MPTRRECCCSGVLEFSAAEGFVALPRKVIRCLWGPNADEVSCEGKLTVTYSRLPKGAWAGLYLSGSYLLEIVGARCKYGRSWGAAGGGTAGLLLRSC